MLVNGYKANENEKFIYYKSIDHAYVIICLYVDDFLIFAFNMNIINAIKLLLKNNFDMKDLSESNIILGMSY